MGNVCPDVIESKGLLQNEELYKYILKTSVYPREHEVLKELRALTASHPRALMGTAPDAAQLIAMFLKVMNVKKTIEIGVFTGYSLLLTALSIPEDGQIVAIDMDRHAFDMGLPLIKKAGVDHKIKFIESPAIPALDAILKDKEEEGSYDFGYVDADKIEYKKYHERVIKLVRIGGVMVYDNTLSSGRVSLPEGSVPSHPDRLLRRSMLDFNAFLASDHRIQLSHASVGDGLSICRRLL